METQNKITQKARIVLKFITMEWNKEHKTKYKGLDLLKLGVISQSDLNEWSLQDE